VEDLSERVEHANKVIDGMTKKQMNEITQREIDRSKKDFEGLKSALEKGNCYYCGHPITHFSVQKPCLHWLLKPKGFKKKHFPMIYQMKSFHEIETYLRWVANCEAIGRNINDWEGEKSDSKVIEETIRFKHLEWSFSCSKGDFEGHSGRRNADFPHYHFQMTVDGKVIINYSGFHIPFHDYDMFVFAVKNGQVPKLSYQHTHGSGIQKMFETFSPEELLDLMNSKDIESGKGKRQFNLQTLVIAPEGIPGGKIAELQQKNKETGVPMARLLREIEGASVVTTIEPGEDIPEIAKRKPRKKKSEDEFDQDLFGRPD